MSVGRMYAKSVAGFERHGLISEEATEFDAYEFDYLICAIVADRGIRDALEPAHAESCYVNARDSMNL